MLAKEQINLFTKIHPSNDATVSGEKVDVYLACVPPILLSRSVPFHSVVVLCYFYGNCGFVALMTATGSGVAEMHFE